MKEFGIIGSQGFLGKEMQRQIEELGKSGVFLTRKEFDILGGEIPRLPQSPEIVIYCADYYPGLEKTADHPEEVYWNNVLMYRIVFEFMVKNRSHKLITIGTTACYPQINEDLTERLIEHATPSDWEKLNPKMRGYALSRFTLLQMGFVYKERFGIEHNHFILPNFYGEGDKFEPGRSHLLSSWVRDFYQAREQNQDTITLWGSPHAQREFIYIKDAASLVRELSKLSIQEAVLNVGTGTSPTYQKIAEEILKAMEYYTEERISWDETKKNVRMREVMDESRLQKYGNSLIIPTPIEEGIANTVQFYIHKINE